MIRISLRKTLLPALSLMGCLTAHAHISYTNRDFGTLDPSGTTTATISNQTSTGNYGWADGTDADYGDSHKLRGFRFKLTSANYVTITFTGSTNGGTRDGSLKPGFSVFSGLAHVSPAAADHDFATISAAWLATRFGVAKEGAFVALGDWKIGNDTGTSFADLSSFVFAGYAVDGTPALFGQTPGLVGDGTADGTVTGTFFLQPGDYTIMVGGANYAGQFPTPDATVYGITGTVSVSATNPAGIFSFSAPQYSAASGATAVNVTVNRYAGGAAASIDLAATSGTAVEGVDFTAPSATVNFAAGETSKVVAITLLPPTGIPAAKSFSVSLSNPSGGATLGGQPTATVAIQPSDVTRPLVSITAPKTGASIKSPAQVIASGLATDNTGVSRVEVSLNDGAYVNANLSGSTWTYSVTPVSGVNTISVRAVDFAGNSSILAFTSFTYVVKSALIATVNPADAAKGTITGLLSGAAYEEGKTYSLTAVAKPGFYFDHWSANQGDLIGANQAKVSFIMSKNLALTAFFVANPYLAAAGSYNGLIKASGATAASNSTTGFITLAITNAGTVGTGSVKIDGLSLSLGVVSFTSTGDALFGAAKSSSLILKRAGKPDLVLTLKVETAPSVAGAHKITGSLIESGTGNASSVSADRAYYNGTSLKPVALLNKPAASPTSGYYTLTFPASTAPNNGYTAAQFPQGDSLATITLSNAGVASVTITLADNTTFTASAPLSFANKVPVFSALYNSKGSFSGELAFDTALADSDVSGTGFNWFRPLSASPAPVYTAGWPNGITVDAVGAKYDASLNFATSLGLTGGAGVLTFTDGKLTTTITKNNFVLSPANVVTKTPASDASFTLTPVQSSGKFSGKFQHNNQAALASYSGILLQKGANKGGFGFFLSAPNNGESGGVTLSN